MREEQIETVKGACEHDIPHCPMCFCDYFWAVNNEPDEDGYVLYRCNHCGRLYNYRKPVK